MLLFQAYISGLIWFSVSNFLFMSGDGWKNVTTTKSEVLSNNRNIVGKKTKQIVETNLAGPQHAKKY